MVTLSSYIIVSFSKITFKRGSFTNIWRRSFQWCQRFFSITCPRQKFQNHGSIVINILRPFFIGQSNRIMIPPAINKYWYYFIYIKIYLAGFLKRLLPNGPFASNSFFRLKSISKVAIIKTKSAIAYLPFRSFFFSFLFPSLVRSCSLSGPKNLPFDPFWLKLMTATFIQKIS